MLTANKQKRHQWQIVEPQQEHKHKIQLCMYLFFYKTHLFGPLFSHDLVPYRSKGSNRCILKQFFSMEPSNKANTVCVQLVRPCNSSEHVQDSNFFITKCDTVYYKLRQYSISRLSYTNNLKLVYLKPSVSTPLYKSRIEWFPLMQTYVKRTVQLYFASFECSPKLFFEIYHLISSLFYLDDPYPICFR